MRRRTNTIPRKRYSKILTPFWEFVSGPLHAGTFGPGAFDNTFGPQLKFKGIPDGMKAIDHLRKVFNSSEWFPLRKRLAR